jgi:membrane protease YdiL (CAAX protease family)
MVWSRAVTWRAFGVLMAGALIGALAILPYSLALGPPNLPPGAPPLPVVLALSVLQTLLLSAVAAATGLWLGPRVGLGPGLLGAWLSGDRTALREYLHWLPLAAGLGVASSVLVLLLDAAVFAPRLADLVASARPANPPLWTGLLASLYGAIDEEILLRLGLMTLLVWLLTRITRAEQPTTAHAWTANILTAIIFGLAHLPATAALVPLTALVVARAIVLNGLAGLVFGWLYWRRGILVAMTSHLCADLVLHVIAPALISKT